MQSIIRHGRWMVGAVALIALLAAAAPASAATTNKPYSLVFASGPQGTQGPTGSDQTNANLVACGSCSSTHMVNNEVASGEIVGITATITNETGTQQLGSANLVPPPGFSALTASPTTGTATVASSCTLNGSPAGPCVQLRSLALAPNGGTVTVTMTVQTPPGNPGNNTWQAEAKQANNFSGSPGNDLSLDSPNSQIITFLDGASSLQFVNQPHNEIIGNAIDGAADWFIGGLTASTDVTVEALDANGAVVPGFIGNITAAIDPQFNPGAGTLSGDTTEAASNGIASFSGLQVNAPANGYRLHATSGTLSPTTSSPNPPPDDPNGFDVAGTFGSCQPPNNSCHTDQPGNGGHAALTATVASGSGLLLESANANNNAQLSCGSKPNDVNTLNTYSFLTTGTLTASKVGTITIFNVQISGSVTKFLHTQQICFGVPSTTNPNPALDFITLSGTPAPFVPNGLPDGSSGFIGLLPVCTGSTPGPCHDANSDTATPGTNGRFTVTLFVDVPSTYAGDPFMK